MLVNVDVAIDDLHHGVLLWPNTIAPIDEVAVDLQLAIVDHQRMLLLVLQELLLDIVLHRTDHLFNRNSFVRFNILNLFLLYLRDAWQPRFLLSFGSQECLLGFYFLLLRLHAPELDFLF
jgi:hypothetical protein